jgi:hypothetical protein
MKPEVFEQLLNKFIAKQRPHVAESLKTSLTEEDIKTQKAVEITINYNTLCTINSLKLKDSTNDETIQEWIDLGWYSRKRLGTADRKKLAGRGFPSAVEYTYYDMQKTIETANRTPLEPCYLPRKPLFQKRSANHSQWLSPVVLELRLAIRTCDRQDNGKQRIREHQELPELRR